MSYVSGYSRRPRYSNVGYNDYPQQAYQGEYAQQPYDNYGGGYQSYQQPQGYGYTPNRRHSYNGRHGSQIQVLPPGSQVIAGDGGYYGNGYPSSRRGPVVVSGDGHYGRHQPHATSSSRYYASNSRGDHIPVVVCCSPPCSTLISLMSILGGTAVSPASRSILVLCPSPFRSGSQEVARTYWPNHSCEKMGL